MLTAAVSLRKQGATKGATTAFLISTPESGVDSIAVTYALLDPILTVARPVAAFITAFAAGIIENLFSYRGGKAEIPLHHPCPVDGCCDGTDCAPQAHKNHHSFAEKLSGGVRYAVSELWADIAGWFFIGLLLAGAITAIIPEDAIGRTVGSGLPAMLIMLAVGIPLYICATASTPIAAALILKGVSPGAALVFLLAGPATNVATLTVLVNILGKRATVIYLLAIAVCAVLFGLAVDQVYAVLGISAKAVAGKAAEIIPAGVQWVAAAVVLVISVKPIAANLCSLFQRSKPSEKNPAVATPATAGDNLNTPPACSGSTCGCAPGPAGDRTD